MNSKKIVNTIYYIVISMLVIILVNNFMSKSDSIFKAVGFRTYSILSGSMEPEINTGDLAIVKSIDAEDNNNANDTEIVRGEDLIGKVLFHMPFLGYVTVFLSKPIVISGLMVLIAISILWDTFKVDKKKTIKA